MFERERLPEGLAEIPPGPELAQILATSNRDMLSGFDRVELMKARYRQVAHDQAELYADMVSIADAENGVLSPDLAMDDIQDVAASEIGAALALTRRAAEYQLSLAAMLVEDYPHVWQALSEGRVDVPKARVICNQTMHLDPETRGRVADTVLVQTPRLTTGQLRARLQRLVIAVDPDSAKKRYEQGVEERRVSSEANPDGTANLYGMQLPAADAQAAMRRINRLARAARSKDDPRTMDQLRADVFLDLLHGRKQALHRNGRDPGVVDIHVDLTTLAGLTENPGDIPGVGTGHLRHRPTGRQRTSRLGTSCHRHRPRDGSCRLERDHPTPADHRSETTCRITKPDLCLPRMPHARHRMRPRPHSPLGPGRPYQHQKPRPRLPP
ncbi:MAG: DUF222 domain-containing protein [Acidimicrobiia bacterium]